MQSYAFHSIYLYAGVCSDNNERIDSLAKIIIKLK